MFDSITPYKCIFRQKASPKKCDAFDFTYIYTFYTNKTTQYQSLKYIIRAEMHSGIVFAIKFYASRDKKLDNKYNKIIKAHNYTDTLKIFITCAYLVPEILKKHSNVSFAINGARSIDLCSNKIEDKQNNQRFRIYRTVANQIFTRDRFEHFEFKEVSSYLLVNKSCEDIIKKKDEIKECFLEKYEFDNSI